MAIRSSGHARGELPRPYHLTHADQLRSFHHTQFNHINGISLIARAHQLVQEGYKHMFDDALVTVWSAPNYCYRCGNSASIMEVKEGGKTEFKVYMAAEENDRDPKNEAARRVSCEYIHFEL